MEMAAEVVRIGEGVEGLRPGDRIIAIAKGGCFRSYATIAMKDMFWVPEFPEYSQLEQAGMLIIFATAIHTLEDTAHLRPGERVLLHSAAGGVGLAAIQVANSLGAEIFATAGSPEKRDYLRSLGVRHVMDSRSLDFADEIMATTGGQGIDVILNFLSGEALEKNLAVLAPFGRLVEIGKRDIEENNGLPMRPFNRNLSFSAIDVDRLAASRPDAICRLMEKIQHGIDEGRYTPVPIQVFPMSNLGEACRFMLKAKHIGKIIVQMRDQTIPIIPLHRAAAE
jgi:NADPH:quinone reductase-like Zn-dependent oxidoreductase